MIISKDTQNVIDFIESSINRKLYKGDILCTILEIGAETCNFELINELGHPL